MPPDGPARQHLWWDSLPETLIQPAPGSGPLTAAIDRLSLAYSAQHSAGDTGAIAEKLAQWCQRLSCNRSDLSTAEAVRYAVDRLDRALCEPQCWSHLTAAEIALHEHIRTLRQAASPD